MSSSDSDTVSSARVIQAGSLPTFAAPRWLSGGHAQTWTVAMPGGLPGARFLERGEPFALPLDEGRLDGSLHWAERHEAPLVVVVHGLGGDRNASYVLEAAHALVARGFHVLRFDMRGAGSNAAHAPYLYHAGLTSDLDAVLRHLAEHPRVTRLGVLGFSCGGNVALKLAGEWAGRAPDKVGAVVSLGAPLDLADAGRNLARWQRGIYRAHVLRGLLTSAVRYKRAHPKNAHYTYRELAAVRQLADFDRAVILPRYGFTSVDEYYAKASSGPWLPHIAVPSLLVHADDDPMVPGAGVRRAVQAASAAVEVHITTGGGHLGWAEGLSRSHLAERWSTRVAADFLGRELSR